jgi:hypothetical protein
MLIEIARAQEGSAPEPSFGTHFFQDLVEASIRYLPLYPDVPGSVFNSDFLASRPNQLAALSPTYAALSDVLRVIDVPAATGGEVVHIVMNADSDEAIAFLGPPTSDAARTGGSGCGPG